MLFTLLIFLLGFQWRCDVFNTNNATAVTFCLLSICGFSSLQDEVTWKLQLYKSHKKHNSTCTQLMNTNV